MEDIKVFKEIQDKFNNIQTLISSGVDYNNPEVELDIDLLNDLITIKRKQLILSIEKAIESEKEDADKENLAIADAFKREYQELKDFLAESKISSSDFYKKVDVDKLYLFTLKAYRFLEESKLDSETAERLYKLNPDCLKSKNLAFLDNIFEIIARAVVFADSIGITDRNNFINIPEEVTGAVNLTVNKHTRSDSTFTNEEFVAIVDVCSRNVLNMNILPQICSILELREYANANNGVLPTAVVAEKSLVDHQRMQADLKAVETSRQTMLIYYEGMESFLKTINETASENDKRKQMLKDYLSELEEKLSKKEEMTYDEAPYEFLDIFVSAITYLNNLSCYVDLIKEYYDSKKDKKTDLLLLCQENDLILTEEEFKELEEKGFKVVQENLQRAKSLGIKGNIALSYFVKYGSSETYNRFNSLLKRGVIGLDFIENNPTIINCSSSVGTNFLTNAGIFSRYKINHTQVEDMNVLLEDNQVVANSVDFLERNSLQTKLNKTNNLNFLGSSELEQRYSEIVDLGFGSLLNDELSLLNYDTTKWQRVRLCRELGLSFSSKEDVLKVLNDTEFFVQDKEIPSYLDNSKKTYRKTNN